MIRILVNEAALKAIDSAASLYAQRQVGVDRYGEAPPGMAPIYLPKGAAKALADLRRPGESYSDVILRYAAVHSR